MMLERTPPEIVASRPVQGGVIADSRTVEQLLAHCMRTAGGPRPRVVVGVPSRVTNVERDAAKIAAEQVCALSWLLASSGFTTYPGRSSRGQSPHPLYRHKGKAGNVPHHT